MGTSLPATGNERNLRTSKRRKPSINSATKHPGVKKLRSDTAEEEILELVRTGVERFILKNATVEDFFRTIQSVAEKEKTYSHQLTRSVFARIVKEAIKKRNLKRSTKT